MDEIRCGNCRRKLGEGQYTRLSLKCPRCGALNHLQQSASGAPQSERHASVKPSKRLYEKPEIPDVHSPDA